MPKTPNQSVDMLRRQQAILNLLASEPLTADEVHKRLPPGPGRSKSNLFKDLTALAKRFPEQVHEEPGADARLTLWSLIGLPPVLLPTAINILTHDELAALIAARGILRAPEARTPGWEKPSTPYAGDLSAALHGLLERSGLHDEVRGIAPTTIGVSRFGIPADPPGALATLERALRTGQAVHFRYRNRDNDERDLHVWSIRLVMIKGEWFCFAWAPARTTDANAGSLKTGKVKQYALARITSRDPAVRIARRLPPGVPLRPPHAEVNAALATGFHATGHGPRTRVILAVSPIAWPFIIGRTWGEGQTIDTPADLPPDWRRIAFSTTGLAEARHWVLSFGSEVRAEHPPELREWLKQQASAILAHLESNPTPVTATPIAVTNDSIPTTSQEPTP